MTEREKMLAGLLYDCGDPELLDQWHRAKDLVRDYNQLDSRDLAGKDRILSQLLGGRGLSAEQIYNMLTHGRFPYSLEELENAGYENYAAFQRFSIDRAQVMALRESFPDAVPRLED